MSLPPELRREIWRYVLLSSCRLRQARDSRYRLRSAPSKVMDGIALLSVCRQIHDEAVEILYEVNLFLLSPSTLPTANSTRFHLLQHVDLELCWKDVARSHVNTRRPAALDAWIAGSILCLNGTCPRPKTCTVFFSHWTAREMAPCLLATSRTASAISEFSNSNIQERLEVIIRIPIKRYATPMAARNFLLAIASTKICSCVLAKIYGQVQVHAKLEDLQYSHKTSGPENVGCYSTQYR